jgi:glycosyltransferase involved in cell wall biosynthesis
MRSAPNGGVKGEAAHLGRTRVSVPPQSMQAFLKMPFEQLIDRLVARPLRVAFIGNSLPRRCGIATFTTDLEQAVGALPGVAETAIFAMRDPGGDYAWPPSVRLSIDQNDPAQYRAAADFINDDGFDIACLQHEFGIYGGVSGDLILGLIAALKVPLVTTLHTVLDQPTRAQRVVMGAILAASARVVVMAHKGRDILIETYGADPDKIVIIPHGIPDAPFATSQGAKERLGFSGRTVLLTFGLISPSKGIETMIEAMPAILAHRPDAVYVVMGATHPHLLRDTGEAYRDSLIARVKALGLEDHVVFLNRFVERPELLEHIAMCDVYVTPYLVASQLTSGTLAYSHGMGRPVVSTPYWHAAELLGDGSGILVPFSNPLALGEAVIALFDNEPARLAMGRKAYAASRPAVWSSTAERYVDCFRGALQDTVFPVIGERDVHRTGPLPETSNRHFMAMCDDTGIFQHAIHTVPDRLHGYCVDDNARALLLCCTAENRLGPRTQETLTARFAAFVQHAWNPDTLRFRNFMGFSRGWLEPQGSEDSHGRTLWALGVCAQAHAGQALGPWAARLFEAALPTVLGFTSPRSWAFALLGLDGYCRACPQDECAAATRKTLANRLLQLLTLTQTPDWLWFEKRLTYDNARLPEALIRTGLATGDSAMIEVGLRCLRWLMAKQTAPAGHFRPAGSQGFLIDYTILPFDQQPLEATATIAACAVAQMADPSGNWRGEAASAFGWFLGANDLGIALVDIGTGICRDGLHPDRANENCGAESVLSWLMALAEMRALAATPIAPLARSLAAPIELVLA